tara:strand:+ start:18508 stop:18738 length:231 start_codon:yes stop_codon:yes gene_type:complete
MSDLEEEMSKKGWVPCVSFKKDNKFEKNVFACSFIYNLQVARIPYEIYEQAGSRQILYVRKRDVDRANTAYEVVIN